MNLGNTELKSEFGDGWGGVGCISRFLLGGSMVVKESELISSAGKDTTEKIPLTPLICNLRRYIIEEQRSNRVLANLAELRSQSFHPNV